MLPADVGAAPAAATRYQGTSSTPAAAAGRERPASGPDPFGDLVDQYADDAEPGATGGHRAAHQAPRQAVTPQPQAQPVGTDTPGAGSTPSNVKAQPHHDDVPPAVVAPDEVRADLVVPAMLTPFDLPRPVERPAGGPGGGAVVPDAARPIADGAAMPGAPLRTGSWLSSGGQSSTGADAAVDPAPLADTVRDLAAAQRPAAPGGVPLDDLEPTEGMPPEAASPDVQAALPAAQTLNPSGAQGVGATVSVAASSRSGRTPQVAQPADPADPRAVAMAAVRQALSQVDDTGPAATPPAAALPDPPRAGAASPVSQPAVAAASHPLPLAASTGDDADAVTTAPDALMPAAQPQAAEAGSTPVVAADPLQPNLSAVRPPRDAKQAGGWTQGADAMGPLDEAASIDEAVQATPGRKRTADDEPVQPARPTARAAQAIAAFHAAAAIGAASTPAGVHAAVAGAAVSSTPLLDTELPTQLIHAIRVQFDQGSGEARIRLNPGFLGGVTIGVQIEGSSVTASLQAAGADVREWMRTNESMLRQALADQGLQLDRLIIVDEEAPASSDQQDTRPRDEREQQAPRRQRRTADQGTFELVF